MLQLRNLVRGQGQVTLKLLVAEILEQVIGAEARAGLLVLHHEIGELVNVSRGFENDFGSDAGAIHLEHVLFKNEVLPPEREDVRFHGAAGRTVVEEAGDAAVDLERRNVEQAPLQRVHHRLPERFAGVGTADEGALDGGFLQLESI